MLNIRDYIKYCGHQRPLKQNIFNILVQWPHKLLDFVVFLRTGRIYRLLSCPHGHHTLRVPPFICEVRHLKDHKHATLNFNSMDQLALTSCHLILAKYFAFEHQNNVPQRHSSHSPPLSIERVLDQSPLFDVWRLRLSHFCDVCASRLRTKPTGGHNYILHSIVKLSSKTIHPYRIWMTRTVLEWRTRSGDNRTHVWRHIKCARLTVMVKTVSVLQSVQMQRLSLYINSYQGVEVSKWQR